MQPVAVIAVGVAPTGVIAIGQLATGVIAVGQLARGVIVVGQLAIGIVTFGQLSLGFAWAGGQLATGAVEGPSQVGVGAFGKLGFSDLTHGRWARFTAWRLVGVRRWAAPLIMIGVGCLVWFVALDPLLHELTKVGGVFREPPRPLR